MPNILFHHPEPLIESGNAGSQIRPKMMLKGFEQIGYAIDLVVGHSKARIKKIEEVKRMIRQGKKYDFLYAESSSTPTALTDSHHLPLHPFLDFNFFRLLQRHHIPIGLFYRDVYWAFEEYEKKVGRLKSKLTRFFYRYDLKEYNKTCSAIFLPSVQMKAHIPFNLTVDTHSLPPGYASSEDQLQRFKKAPSKNQLVVFYVGGVSNLYNQTEFLKAVAQCKFIRYIICCRKSQFEGNYEMLAPFLNSGTNIEIVHKQGKCLDSLYEQADLVALAMEPITYRTFAMPVKLFEYIGHGKPVIASDNTAVGDLIRQQNIGWSVQDKEDNYRDLLTRLYENKDDITKCAARTREFALHNAWKDRAAAVRKYLVGD